MIKLEQNIKLYITNKYKESTVRLLCSICCEICSFLYFDFRSMKKENKFDIKSNIKDARLEDHIPSEGFILNI